METFNRFEVCWYLYEERQQFRIAGTARLIDGSTKLNTEDAKSLLELRRNTWKSLSTNMKKQYILPSPGQPLEGKALEDATCAQAPVDAPPNFALILLEPDSVDHLTLTEPMMRIRHRRPPDNGGWLPPAPLNP